MITDDGKCDTEICRRIEIARNAFHNMNKVLTSRDISLQTRKRIVKCYIWTTLLYGSDTWTITQANMKKLQSFEMWVYRKMLKISWIQKIRNEDVMKMINTKEYVVPTIKKRQLSFFGHMIRRDNMHRLLLEGKIDGKRGRGRPRAEWMDNIFEWIGTSDYGEVVRMAQNRERWRIMAANLLHEDGT